MSDITLDFVVANNNINIYPLPNDITISPTVTSLEFYSTAYSQPGGANTQLQYNNNGSLAGIPTVTYNGNLNLGSLSINLSIFLYHSMSVHFYNNQNPSMRP